MRILYSFPHPSDTLAAERAGHVLRAASLVGGLEDLGHTVERVEAAAGRSAQAGVDTYRGFVRRVLPSRAARAARDVARVVHGRRFARRLVEVGRRGPFDVLLETHVAFSTAGARAARALGIPLALDDVAPAWEERELYGGGLDALEARVRRQVLGHAALLVTPNATLRDELATEGVDPARLAVVENGVSPGFYDPGLGGRGAARRRALGFGADDLVAVFVGSFQPYHRAELLVEALAGTPPAVGLRVLLVGDGSTRSGVLARAEALGVARRVVATGRVPHDEIPELVAAADVGVMPATNDYGDPMKLYEYLAAGRPVVAPRQRGIEGAVVDGRNAVLFPPGDVAALAACLTGLRDADRRSRLAAAAAVDGAGLSWRHRAAVLGARLEDLVA